MKHSPNLMNQEELKINKELLKEIAQKKKEMKENPDRLNDIKHIANRVTK